MSGRFAGRRALVTGGEGAIGQACVERLVAEGARVAALDQLADPAGAGADRCAVRGDVADEQSVRAAVAEATRRLGGPVDVLVTAAGIFVVTLAVGLAIGAVWEMIEYASDNTLGSDLQIDNDDTVGDLFADGLGALCGAALLVLWSARSWGSVRRIPGENRFEGAE